MVNLLALILTAFALFIPVVAQDSPFGNISGESENPADRKVTSVDGKTLEDYKKFWEEYTKLNTTYNNSFGSQKTVIGNILLARAKDVLFTKLGATEVYLVDIASRLEGTDKEGVESLIAEFRTFINETTPKIDAAKDLNEIRSISISVNQNINALMGTAGYYVSKVSVANGLYLVDLLMYNGDLVQAHIDASAELGGNTAPIQDDFNTAMLTLEQAKDGYTFVGGQLATTSPNNASKNAELLQYIYEYNTGVAKAHETLREVVFNLKVLYGQSPWAIELER